MNTMTDALKRAACAAIDAQAQRLTAFGRDILAHPELGYKETRTAGKVLEAFASLGLTDVTRPARTGVKGWLWRGAGPRVAVIGELDAVLSPGHPFADKATGAAHACGHNAQLASMLGCAVGLRAVADSLAGSVCLLAAPAEEYVEIGWRAGLRRAGEVQYLGGKQQLIAEGAFDDIDMAMMVHSETDAPQPRAVVAGAAGGFIGKELRFLGKEAHAGGAPWEGVNALNAASLAIAAIHANRETFRDEDHVRVHPIITKGGDLVNTVPADVRMESYVRAASVQAMRTANAKVNRAARGAAYAVGARVEIDDMPGYLPGVDQEHAGVIRHGAKVLYAYSEATVPKITVILRKAYGGGYIAMNSRHLGADFMFAWPSAEIAVMGPEGAIAILYHKELAAADDPVALKKDLLAQYRDEVANPYIANEKGFIDEVIDPAVTRQKVIRVLKSLEKKSVSLPRRKHGNIPL